MPRNKTRINKTYIATGFCAFGFFFVLGGMLPTSHKTQVTLKSEQSINKASTGPIEPASRYWTA